MILSAKTKTILTYALIAAVVFLPGSVKYLRLLRHKRLNEAKLQSLIKENKRLAEENKRLKEDPVYIEKIARENLGLVKKGEIVVKFKNTDTKQ